MTVESFDDTSMNAGPVPKRGTKAAASPPSASGSANGIPSGVEQADGTENMRGETQTKQAAGRSTPGGSANHIPGTVDTFKDGVV